MFHAILVRPRRYMAEGRGFAELRNKTIMLIARKPWSYHQEPYYLQEPLEPSDPIAPDPEPDRYPVTDPIPSPGPSPSPEPAPFPAPPEPIPEFPPDVNF